MGATVIIDQRFFRAMKALAPADAAATVDFVNRFSDNPGHPGLSLHPIDRTRATGLWSARVSDNVRAVVHKEGETWAILHVDRHDDAYAWAERRKVVLNSHTGDLQIVAVREVEEIRTKTVMRTVHRDPLRFAHYGEAYLTSLGVPDDWLPVLREVRSDDDVLHICERLDEPVAERLLALAHGELVAPPRRAAAATGLAESDDARRHFYVVEDRDELARVLNAPLDAWMAFLHPTQRGLVSRSYRGPAKVTGSAGTGKTVVALHRARRLAAEGHRVLLTSFVTTLCDNLDHQLAKLCSPTERARITTATLHKVALDVVGARGPKPRPLQQGELLQRLEALRAQRAPAFDAGFVRAEFENVIQRQGVMTWDAYRGARRVGRGRALSVTDRKTLWAVFAGLYAEFERESLADWSSIVSRATGLLTAGEVPSAFDAVLVDEVQDLRPVDLRFVAALAAPHPDRLLLVGDAGQRIYPGSFSLRALGIDVGGRSTVLRINYRTTEQIRRAADHLLGEETDDLDEGRESRLGTRSLLRGPEPTLRGYPDRDAELRANVAEVRAWIASGLAAGEIAIFARTHHALTPLARALEEVGLPAAELGRDAPQQADGVRLGTLHRAKGLEFKAVIVHGSDGVPNDKALAASADPQDREEALARERSLLYVAMTRARDRLRVTWSGTPSPFLESLTATTP